MTVRDLLDRARAELLHLTPDRLDPVVADLPDWALFLGLPVVALLLVGLLLHRIFDAVIQSKLGFRRFGRLLRGRSFEDPDPATAEGQAEARLAAERLEAKMDAILAAVSPPPGASRLTPEELAAKKEAARSLVTELSPAAIDAGHGLAVGNITAGFDLLEQQARQSEAEAAERWRRLGALAVGIDTARARKAYEEAFRLQPEHFWTCIELARVRSQSGDLPAAGQAALAARKAARSDRELMVARSGLGDVLVKAGDLSGAKGRFEESLKVRERLAETNPGSAEAQRDLIVSYAKLGSVLPGQGWWARGLAVCERLVAEGRLAPADQWMLQELSRRAADDAEPVVPTSRDRQAG